MGTNPPGRSLSRALALLAEDRELRPADPLPAAVDRVARALDLSPADSEWLLRAALADRRRPPGGTGSPRDEAPT